MEGQKPHGRKICGAKTRAGGKCQRSPRSNGRCNLHGGKSPAPGPLHPNWKHGNNSKLTKSFRLLDRLNELEGDPRIFDIGESIKLFQLRLLEILEQLDTGAPPELWNRAKREFRQLREAMLSGDKEGVAQGLKTLGETIDSGDRYGRMWNSALRVADQKTKLIERMERIQERKGQRLLVSEVLAQLSRMMQRAIEVIGDYDAIRYIFAEHYILSEPSAEPIFDSTTEPSVQQTAAGEDETGGGDSDPG